MCRWRRWPNAANWAVWVRNSQPITMKSHVEKPVRAGRVGLAFLLVVFAVSGSAIYAQDTATTAARSTPGQSTPGQSTPDAPDPLAQKTPEGMVYIAAGAFTMGTNSGEGIGPNVPRETNDARPEHSVEVAAFYLDKTEVTNADYGKYCEATGYPPPPHW